MKFDFHKFLAVVNQIGPVVLAAVPGGEKIGPLIPKVVAAIGEAEQIKGASGADKKRHVMNVFNTAVGIANSTGKVKIDAAGAAAAASTGIDTVIQTVNVIKDAKPDEGAPTAVEGSAEEIAAAHATATAPPASSSVPAVDANTSSNLGDGHATHGHGSGDNLKS